MVWFGTVMLTGSRDNTTLEGTPGKLDPGTIHLPRDEQLSPAPIEEDLDEWFYVDRDALDVEEKPLEGSDLRIVLDLG